MTGTIRTLRTDKGFGFIKDAGGKEYFFHQSAVQGGGDQQSPGGRLGRVRGRRGAKRASRGEGAADVDISTDGTCVSGRLRRRSEIANTTCLLGREEGIHRRSLHLPVAVTGGSPTRDAQYCGDDADSHAGGKSAASRSGSISFSESDELHLDTRRIAPPRERTRTRRPCWWGYRW